MYFQYAKIRPFLEEFRAKNSLPGLFVNLQKLVDGSEKGRRRFLRRCRVSGVAASGKSEEIDPASKRGDILWQI
jgi:hypothetical protein